MTQQLKLRTDEFLRKLVNRPPAAFAKLTAGLDDYDLAAGGKATFELCQRGFYGSSEDAAALEFVDRSMGENQQLKREYKRLVADYKKTGAGWQYRFVADVCSNPSFAQVGNAVLRNLGSHDDPAVASFMQKQALPAWKIC